MINELQLLGKEIERDIVVLQQTSNLKSFQLDEIRKKLHKEIVEHQVVRNCLDKGINELDVIKKELGHNLKANERLQEENKKCRELIARLQSQNEFYSRERPVFIDRCHAADIEICSLKNQIGDLEDRLQEHKVYKELYEQFQVKNQHLIDQILRDLDILTKEQNRLDNSVKEGLAFISKLSEELNVQSLFLKESNISRTTLENEMLRLIGVLEEERFEKRRLWQSLAEKATKENYLEDVSTKPSSYVKWKCAQEEMNKKIGFFMEENKRLLKEVEKLKVELDTHTENTLGSWHHKWITDG